MASSLPATPLPSAPTTSFPRASTATQIKLPFISLLWPWAWLVGRSGLVKNTAQLPAGWLVLPRALLHQAGISPALRLPLKNPAPRFLFPSWHSGSLGEAPRPSGLLRGVSSSAQSAQHPSRCGAGCSDVPLGQMLFLFYLLISSLQTSTSARLHVNTIMGSLASRKV